MDNSHVTQYFLVPLLINGHMMSATVILSCACNSASPANVQVQSLAIVLFSHSPLRTPAA